VCCKPAPVCCAPAPAPTCCASAPACCEESCHHHHWTPFGRLRGLFHREHECCDSGCGSPCGGCGAAPGIAPAPAPVPAGPAQKMPATIGSTGTIITPARIGLETEGSR